MDFDSSDNSNANYPGKIKTQTFKQFQLERLIKDGKVIQAFKLGRLNGWSCSASGSLRRRQKISSATTERPHHHQ